MLDEIERKVFSESRTVAVVGLSDDRTKPSYHVAEYLVLRGYNIIPVNPRVKRVLERKCYPNLVSVDQKVDVVDVFRRPEYLLEIAIDAVRIGARVLWMQEGIVNQAAAEQARAAGLTVIMDRCMFKEHLRLFPPRNRR